MKIKNLSNSRDTITLYKILSSNNELIDVKANWNNFEIFISFCQKENEYYIKGDVLLKKRPIKDLIVFLKQGSF